MGRAGSRRCLALASMIETILFDFGQTLVDSSEGFRKAEKDAQVKIFENLAFDSWPEFLGDYRELRKTYHDSLNFSRKELWEGVYRYYQRKVDEAFLLEMEEIYWETVKLHTRPFPEALGVLEKLSKHYKLGMITNTQGQVSYASHRISLFPEIEGFFEVIIVAGEKGIPAKPHPTPFLLCLSKMGFNPSESVYVGDDWRIDIRGAEGVGIQPVWIKHHSVHRTWPEGKSSIPVIYSLDELFHLAEIKL